MSRRRPSALFLFFGLLAGLLLAGPASAAIQVSISGPGGGGSAVLPDAGGAFAVDIPLNRNSINPLTITARDEFGNVRSAELAITQVSLDQIVVSEVTAERLTTEEIEQLVTDGVIDLDDPANYNVSEFAVVLTIAGQEVPVTVPIPFPKIEQDPVGYENIRLPQEDDSSSSRPPPPPPPDIVVFVQEFSTRSGGPTPPPIPGVIIIEGRIKSLKEFFSVRLLLMNTSGIFTLTDVMAELEFPDGGLTAMLPADGLASFGDILPGTPDQPGALEKEFIIRGDQIGEKTVRVNFGGTVAGPGIPAGDEIPFNGSAETTVEVKGPPAFQVMVTHPAAVTSGVPYDLTVEILNKGELPALYASLELDVSADARLADCTVDEATGEPDCEYVDEPVVQSLGHIDSGERVSVTYTVLPTRSGRITSCMGVSDQNITLQVVVGDLGCVAGHYPPDTGAPEGIPTVTAVPVNNAQGISVDSPVVAFFSERMNHATIHAGSNGTFNVVDAAQEIVPGQIRIETNLSNRTIAIWQVNDGVLSRLQPGGEYTVYLSQGILDLEGNPLFNEWVSTFQTTTMGANDTDPPQLTLSIEPPVNPNEVLPGEVVTVNAYAVDQGSGIARVELRMKDLDGTNLLYTLVDQKSVFAGDEPPFLFALDSAGFALGHTVQLLATAYDGMGNVRDATLALQVASSADPPVITLPEDPAVPVLQGISVTLKPVALTGGVRAVRYYLDGAAEPYKTVTLPPWQASLSTLTLPYGAYAIRAVAVDGLGQTGEDTYAFSLVTNPSLPVVSFPGSVDGEVHMEGSSFAVYPRVEDEVGVRSVHVYLASPVTNLLATNAGPVLIDTSLMETGTHHVIVLATNQLGKVNDPALPDSRLEFRVVPPAPGVPPDPPVVISLGVPDGGYAPVTGTSSNHARVDIENLDFGGQVSVYTDGTGAFSAGVAAEAGDRLQLVAYDLEHCPDPSVPSNVIVPAPPVLLGIQVLPASFTLASAGAHRDLEVRGAYDTGQTNDITAEAAFASTDPAVASVNDAGRVVAVRRGSAAITASVGGFTRTSSVFVDIVSLTNLLVVPAEVNLVSLGQTRSLAVTGQYNNGSAAALPTGNSFVSGDPAVATVDGGGVVTATGDGWTEVMVYRSGVPSVAVPVRVDTAADPPPVVGILQPLVGASVEPGDVLPVTVQAQDPTVGVVRVYLSVTGAMDFAETRQVLPASPDTTQVFNLAVPGGAPVGGMLYIRAWAGDTGGKLSATGTVAVTVVDTSPPVVDITAPAPGDAFGYGDALPVQVQVTDATGVTQIWAYTTGAMSLSETQTLNPAATDSNVVFNFTVPYGVPYPDVTVHAEAWDGQGLKGTAISVPITISDADITPPATHVAAVADPGAGTTATVTYEVTDGLDDLDHVEIFFRRDGYGTFNRYTDADGGNALGHYFPQGGSQGTMTFDSTKMGGDGIYEFYSIGVDEFGNRELAPTNASGTVTADQAQVFAAGTAWVTISTDTNLAAGNTTHDNANLRVDGATVTLDGHHDFLNVELLNGAMLTHPETDGSVEYGLDVSLWTLTVDSNSAVKADGRGYLGGERPGNEGTNEGRTQGNAPGSTIHAGGSHGGSGGALSGGTANDLYGDLTAPADPGSGGGRGVNDSWPGADGGGRIRFQAVNIVNDGLMTANGQVPSGYNAGSGSGGAIYLTVSTMSGTGQATANGGGFEVGGGGGRLALHHVDISTFEPSRLRALGGVGTVVSGGNGTVFVRSVTEGGGTLIVDGQGAGSSFSTLPIPPGYVFDTVIIRNNARVLADDEIVVSNELQVLSGSIISHSQAQANGVRIDARAVYIDSSSSIDVSGKGYLGGEQPGNSGTNQGRTLNNQLGAAVYAGGSHGGAGGADSGAESNPVYGDPRHPVALGSGGGRGDNDSWPGGNGGGRVTITAADSLFVEGTIRADGNAGSGYSAGSGSGGSVWIDTSRLHGSGLIAANGGSNEVGGAGGRVAIAYDYLGESGDDLNGLRNISTFGGHGSRSWGGAGTVVLRRHDQTHGDLYVDDNMTGATSGAWTPLPHVGFGTVQALSADTLQTDGTVAMLPGGLAGLELNPNSAQAQTFTVVDNTATTLTVDVSGGTTLTDVAAVGNRYAARHRFDNVIFRRGGFLVTGDKVIVGDTVTIDEYGRWTHFDATTAFESRLDLDAGALVMAANGFIDADGRGYLGGERPGNSGTDEGRTLGNVPGSSTRAGGSHGGLGGHNGGVPAVYYGSLTQPAALGSGGGRGENDSWPGADGGGWIRIRVGSLQVEGVISANGSVPNGYSAGSGSGGCIDIGTGLLAGNGLIRANGGGGEVGGGGGRIAIRHDTLAFDESHLEARGGAGGVMSGGNGTVFLKQSAQPDGDLLVDGHDAATPTNLCFIPGGYIFDNVTLRNRAEVNADEGLTVSNVLSLVSNSILTHTLEHEPGLSIVTRDLVVDATSAIDVSGRGYRGGMRDGNPSGSGRTLNGQAGAARYVGGSYGGLGAEAPIRLAFGDPLNPVHLGSGGGYGDNASWPGANGGGRVDVTADEIQVDGAIRANGEVPDGQSAGSGSGGSVRIDTSILRGTGSISADGGAFQRGGGGGRIAIAYDSFGAPGDDLDGTRNITAHGGHGTPGRGSAGTVVLRQHSQTHGDLIVDDNVAGATSDTWTPLTRVGFGTVQALTADTLTSDGTVACLPGALVGLRLNPNTAQSQYFEIVANTTNEIIVDVPGTLTLLDVAATGDEYAAVHSFDNVTFRRGGFLVCGDILDVDDTLHLAEYGRLTHFDAGVPYESRLELRAGTLQLATNGYIDVNGRGYLGGERPGNEGVNEGRTLHNQIGAAVHAGGSHGGLGGTVSGAAVSKPHGEILRPAALGSGGGRGVNDSWPGADGGGQVHAVAATAVVNGVISADGSSGGGYNAGSGSGGTVFMEAGHLEGAGFIQANGGLGEVGGGGGRVAVHYNTLGGPAGDMNGQRNITAFGGHPGSAWGSAGTVLLKQSGQSFGDLYVDDGVSGSTALNWTPLPEFGFGTVQAVSSNTLQLDGTVELLPGGLVGNKILPDRTTNRYVTVTANTATSVTVETGTDLTTLTAVGRKYAGLHRFDNVYFRRGGFLASGDRLAVEDTLHIAENGILTHPDATVLFESALDVLAGNLVIAADGAVDTTGRGYLGGERLSNAGVNEGRTEDNAIGSTVYAGGSHGGLGGTSSGGTPNPVYGSAAVPVDLGSGGGRGANDSWPGSDGGGRIAMQAGTMQVDGVIAADGTAGGGYRGGGGSGGSVYIRTGALSGQGTIRANGGGGEVGGGGGRIAIYFTAGSSATNSLNFSAAANGATYPGQDGSRFFDDTYAYVPFAFIGDGGGSSGVSPFRLHIVSLARVTDGAAKVSWTDSMRRTASPAAYVVEFAPDLLARTNWIPLEGKWGDGEWEGALPGDARNGFIRIRRVP